ncbi:MAG: NACHT domain-containing protein [Candidatus Poribacteria bacterium]|nr:NACHT domain-containing protein [Candidatus Poribacteria bacterium]
MVGKFVISILTKVVSVFSKEAWERVKNRHQNSKNASHDYDSPYKKRHGQLYVSCVGIEPSRYLDDVYVVVQFLSKRRATKHNSIEDVGKALQEKGRRYFNATSDKRQNGMRIATNEQYLMVLGGPGVGKSTFLRKVGLEALKGEDGNFEHQCRPIFLELKNFRKDQIDIKALIINEFKVCGYPHPELIADAELEAGELLILFDGLDEVPKSNLNNISNKIRDFVHQYSQNRFIVSCRAAAYTGGFAEFTVVEIADFDDSQIQDYINNWFASGSNRKMKTDQRCWKTLNDPEHQAVKALAQNPLSLALLCTIYEASQDFPSSQATLYEKIFNIFLKKWTAEKGVRRDSPMSPYLAIPTVKELLSEIAAENFKADRLVFSEDELINQIQEFYQRRTDISSRFDASEILDALLVDPGLFVERANGIYSFFHLTFQEYLTANHFVKTRSIQNLVSNHLHNDQYREIFLFTAELMHTADNLLVAMEEEASKFINAPKLKTLSGWAERITTTSNGLSSGLVERAFAIRQYFFLRILNKIHETVKERTRQSQDFDFCCVYDFSLDSNFYKDLELYEDIYPYLYLDLYHNLYHNLDLDLHLYQDLYRDLEFYLDVYRELYKDFVNYLYLNHDQALFFYHDFYRYMDRDFLFSIFSKFGDRFDRELRGRIELVKRIKQMKIFKCVDLQQMVQQFNAQREFIKAAGKGEPVELPTESIHDTWLSVFGITNDMLEISDEELANYLPYLRGVELIVACKTAARRTSPKVWQKIEERLLT